MSLCCMIEEEEVELGDHEICGSELRQVMVNFWVFRGQAGCSGLPDISGRVIRVFETLGFQNDARI